MKEFLVVCFVEKNLPKEFLSGFWPLHVTIVRPFTTELSAIELTDIVQQVATQYSPLTLRAKSREMFGGRHRDIPVTELEKIPEIQQLHEDLLARFGSRIHFKPPQHDFRPHVTDQKSGQIAVGDEVHLNTLSLIEEEGNRRVIIETSSFNLQ